MSDMPRSMRGRSWVRLLDDRLYVTFAAEYEGEPVEARTRPLTWRERWAWRTRCKVPTRR